MEPCAGEGMKLAPVAEMLRQLAQGEVTSRQLVESCLEAIADPAGEGSRTYLTVYADAARSAADEADAQRRFGKAQGALLGIPVSIKDLFDVAGETTRAGSIVLTDAPPAMADAMIVQRLKEAGAILMGRTNMTEFAYSGLGLNPHYGTPRNPFDRESGRIAGGSSSGAAVSVTDGMAAVGIGTDTGGSVRIPAALCGLSGFKPTARRIPSEGMLPLAASLDSIGPIARTIDCCERIDAVLAGETFQPRPLPAPSSLRLGVLGGYVLEDLEPAVSRAFDQATKCLANAGAVLESVRFPEMTQVPSGNQFAAAEAFAWHRVLLGRQGREYDRHVSARIWHGAAILAADYLDMMRLRREIIQSADAAFAGYDALLLPTTHWTAPKIAALEASDEAYFEANGAMLRNTSLINYLDGCAATVPCHVPGEAPVGLMIAGLAGWDANVLRMSAAIEPVVAPVRRIDCSEGPHQAQR